MGVTKRPNGRWRARIIGPDGRERARHFVRRSDAVRWETDQRAALNRGAWVDPSGPITVVEYAREWATTRPHRPSTARRTASFIEVHIAGTSIENRRLASLRPSEVQAWATERAQILAPSTARSAVQLLRSIYNAATLDLLVGSNPVIGVKLPAYERERIVPRTVAQVQALADAMPERCRAMVMTQAGLGLRIGELFGLRAQDVDFLRRTVRIE